MKQPLRSLLESKTGTDVLVPGGFVDLTITFIDPKAAASTHNEEILQEIPTVRILMAKQ